MTRGTVAWLVLILTTAVTSASAENNFSVAPAHIVLNDIEFLRSGIPMTEWMAMFYNHPSEEGVDTVEAEDSDGVRPAPEYVPAEEFSPDQNRRVILGPMVGENILVNDRQLCGGRGNTQSETSIAANGDVIVVAWNESKGFYCTNHSTVGWGYSLDGGATFTDGGTLPGGLSRWSNGDPALAIGPDGSFYVSGISSNFNGMSISRGVAGPDGVAWNTPVEAVSRGGLIDKEWLAVDQATGRVYMAYGRSQQIEVIHSDDQGATWNSTTPARLGGGGIGANPLIGPNGEVYVAWNIGWPSASQRIVMARSEDGGGTFTSPVTIANLCAFTVPGFSRGQVPAFPSVAIDLSGGPQNGRLYVAWHSSCPSGNGDAYLSSSDDQGQTWSEPIVVNDDGATALQWSPSVSVDSSGNVNVVFYDRRENPGTGITNVYLAQSTDGGMTFLPNIRITDVASNWSSARSDISPNMGDYLTAISVGTDVLVSWSDARDGDPDAYFTRISPTASPK
ncbi:MAG: exo-alpha-sialidase [Acidobacteria bacterium]|nr:exo-alpha-sialidase [Acidobacteriota bacterium]MBI3656282.1 exo-alpha-sialidase [Acidobacteriota bacterium]